MNYRRSGLAREQRVGFVGGLKPAPQQDKPTKRCGLALWGGL
jgi:hypothetical protein